jgi:hypothetical protein
MKTMTFEIKSLYVQTLAYFGLLISVDAIKLMCEVIVTQLITIC